MRPQRRAPYVAALMVLVGVLALSTMATRWSDDDQRSSLLNSTSIQLVREGAAAPPTPPRHDSFAFSAPKALSENIRRVQLTRGDGTQLTFEAFRGKHVLVNIWATWCPPCREEMPSLDRLQERLGGEDFEVVALSIDDALATVHNFYAELNLKTLQVYLDDARTSPTLLNILGLPTTLLLDPDGNEVARFTGPAEWDSDAVVAAITELLSKYTPRAGAK